MPIKITKFNQKYIIIITIAIVVLMVSSAFIEISSSKREILKLLDEEAISLIKAINSSAENTILSGDEIENLITNDLFGIAEVVKGSNINQIKNSSTIDYLIKLNNINQLIITNNNGKILYSINACSFKLSSIINELAKSYNNETYTEFVPGIIKDDSNSFYFIATKRENGSGYIFVGLDSKYLLEFRKKIGLGTLFKNLANQNEIEYIVLQDYDGIVAASKNIKELNSIQSDEFLINTVKQDTIATRIYVHNEINIYEAVQPLLIEDDFYGIIRIGLSMQSIYDVNQKMYRRIIITTFIIIGIGVIFFSLVLANQHRNTLQYEFKRLQTYNEKILENMADGVLAIKRNGEVFFVNKSAENILNIESKNIIGKNIKDIFKEEETQNILLSFNEISSKEFVLKNGTNKIIKINKSNISDIENPHNTLSIIILQDITEEKNLEQQLRRNEKMIAMGELAGGVAHEVRNPLNSISIIIQRLMLEFEPKTDKETYLKLISTIREEISRLNKIIEQFLKFAKRPKLNLVKENISELVKKSIDIIAQEAKNIKIIENIEKNLFVKIDRDQILQALINILKNSIQAIEKEGIIEIILSQKQDYIHIQIKDNGKGIPKENLNKIFNLYYSTKPYGTGIGLSIVNQIISEHNGRIEVESEINKGTAVNIYLPIV